MKPRPDPGKSDRDASEGGRYKSTLLFRSFGGGTAPLGWSGRHPHGGHPPGADEMGNPEGMRGLEADG